MEATTVLPATAENCIHCHLCTDNCSFLAKYGIDIGDTEKLRDLAYHCFLCGRCTEVCPVNIDGRQVVLDLRRERVTGGEKQSVEKKYKSLIREKRDYIYRNWKNATSGTVFFPGCNFPSMYPKTNSEIVRLLRDHGIGTVYECCGKPIAELGLEDDEVRIIEKIRGKLSENNINEIVTACPNCRDFFGDRLGVRVTSIFSKFTELGLGKAVDGDFAFYVPCPDRTARKWIEEIRPFINGKIDCIEGVQCCGLGGSAAVSEPDITDTFTENLRNITAEAGDSEIVTYCASCTGRFRRSGFGSIDHFLTRVMGTDEAPDTKKSYLNRVMTRFK